MPQTGIHNQFNKHKQAVLNHLTEVCNEHGVYTGTNAQLSVVIGEWGQNWRVGVTPRQVSRYLKALRDEGKITVERSRFQMPTGQWRNRRTIKVNVQLQQAA